MTAGILALTSFRFTQLKKLLNAKYVDSNVTQRIGDSYTEGDVQLYIAIEGKIQKIHEAHVTIMGDVNDNILMGEIKTLETSEADHSNTF